MVSKLHRVIRTLGRRDQGIASLAPREILLSSYRYFSKRLQGEILSLTLEITGRCNARCDFCGYWNAPRMQEDVDFVDVVRRLDPLVVFFCGGEPLLRRDLVQIVRAVTALPKWRYCILITNGSLLTEAKAHALREAGIRRFSISLDWPDERHDEERKLPGLFAHLSQVVPALASQGLEVSLNTVVMKDNLEELVRLARLAETWGAKISYTLYSPHCNGNNSHALGPAKSTRLAQIVEELIAYKRQRGTITNSPFYLRKCVDHCRGEEIPGCPAGRSMIHVSPQGLVKPCADLPTTMPYTLYSARSAAQVDCTMCWMACRGEVQAPTDLARVREIVGL